MKASLTILLFFVLTSVVFAQLDVDIQGLNDVSPYNRGTKGFDLRYEGVKGTPLLFEDWQVAKIQLANRDTFSASAKINIDLEQNVLLLQWKDGKVGQISLSKIKAFQTEDKDGTHSWQLMTEKEVEGTTNSQLKVYETLSAGKFTLLKSVKKSFKKANFKEAYSIGNRFDEYIMQVDYWLREEQKPYQEIKLKRKALEEALPRQTSRIESVLKKQKLNLGDEKEMVVLLKALEEAQ